MEVMMKRQIRHSRNHKTKHSGKDRLKEMGWIKRTTNSVVNEVNELIVKEEDD